MLAEPPAAAADDSLFLTLGFISTELTGLNESEKTHTINHCDSTASSSAGASLRTCWRWDLFIYFLFHSPVFIYHENKHDDNKGYQYRKISSFPPSP